MAIPETNKTCCIIHTRYLEQGGEDVVVEAEMRLLQADGWTTSLVEFSNASLADAISPISKLTAVTRSIWSPAAAAIVKRAVDDSKPSVVHVHNTFPSTSPSVLKAARDSGAAIVMSLHNFRLLCPNALLFRNGHVCQDCVGSKTAWPAIVHKCYRASYSQSGAAAALLSIHRALNTWALNVDVFITTTEFARSQFVSGGLPADRVLVKPHFVNDIMPPPTNAREGFAFVGRLVGYKGVRLLLRAWSRSPDLPSLSIVGDGPLLSNIEQQRSIMPSVRILGRLSRSETLNLVSRSRALVFPSECYETFGLAMIEAFACGTPVIASNIGAMAEIVGDGQTGLLFESGNSFDLASKVKWAEDHPHEMARMGARARMVYEERYTAARNLAMINDIYAIALSHRQ